LADDAPSDDGPEQATDSEHAGEAVNGEASGDADEERFPIVGIGASAGGIGALEAFFEPLPSGLDMAFVVVQHLSPEHESRLADLLQGHTEMPVEQVEETVALEPGHVYVIPPGKNLSITDDELTPTSFEEPRGQRAPIDFFFRSLAETHGERAVGIVLSGTGQGGTLGLGRIKERGGVTMAQVPDEATHPSMARSAIAANQVDIVAPVAELAEQLARIRRDAGRIALPATPDELTDDGTETLHKIFAQLQAKTGHDFTHHKRASILRRLRRRMQVAGAQDLPAYLDYLRSHPDETQALFKDLLISVTSFFRDPDAFAALEEEVIPALFEGKDASDQVRVWVPGCATGEEAYSLTMLLREQASLRAGGPDLQVFASDIDEDALAMGRRGFYPDLIEADVSAQRLQRFFSKESGGYRVSSELRDPVLFARHNLLSDPPFSGLDLIACRNLMIYLGRGVQDQVLNLFHYALRPGGYLFLGPSESADGASDHFATIDKTIRLYRSREAAEERLPQLPLRDQSGPGPAAAEIDGRTGQADAAGFGALHQQMLEAYAPPSAVVEAEEYTLVHLSDRVGRYFQLPGGRPSQDILDLVHPDLRVDLQTTLYRAAKEGVQAKSKPVALTLEGERRRVRLTVRPAAREDADPGGATDLLLVIFDEQPEDRADRPAAGEAEAEAPGEEVDPSLVERLQEELRDTRERLQATIEEYETSNEELRASNEELQSMNEELRSTSEELETSKEELQSMNEELTTVNEELEGKNEELSRARDDLHNLITSTRIATLFLDRHLHLKRYTEAATDLFNVRPPDLGRPFEHLTHRIEGADDIAADAQQVLDTLTPVAREVSAHAPAEDEAAAQDETAGEQRQQRRQLLMRLLPYRTTEDKIEGVVLTFVDITERKEAEEELRQLKESLEERVEERTRELREREAREGALLRALPDPVLRITGEGTIEDVHNPDGRSFLNPREELLGQPFREALPGSMAGPLSGALDEARATGASVTIELTQEGEGNAPATTFETRLAPVNGSTVVVLRDVSERRRLEREMLEAGDRKQQEIAEDLHDELGQQLLGAHFLCRSLRRRLAGGDAEDNQEGNAKQGEHVEALDEIAGEIDAASDYVRNLSRMLSAVDTEEGRGLGEALGHLAERTERAFEVTCTYESEEEAAEEEAAEPTVSEAVATSLYRIAQEAVTNAVRHAHASTITIRHVADAEGLMLRVEDDGEGIPEDVAEHPEGLGLRTMQHRADLIGAQLDVSPRRTNGESGTVVTCLLRRAHLQGASNP
jgi:two-component system CheB/CheR fusion protein